MAPAVRKTIPPPPDANDGSMNGFAHEQGAFKTTGGKNHQPLDKSRRWNLSQFNGLREVIVNEKEPRSAPRSGLPAFAQHCFREAKTVHADRNTAIDRDLREHRADLVRREPVAQCAADVSLEFLHFSERVDHAEIENRALARGKRIAPPCFAPAILRHDALKIAIEVVGALERAVDIFFAQPLAAHGEAAVMHFLVHGHSSVVRSRAASAASRVSIAGFGNVPLQMAS